jgi:hypothetical protein
VAEPLWKANLERGRTAEALAKQKATRKANTSVKHAMLRAAAAYQFRGSRELLEECRKFADANDNLGLEVFLLEHMCGSAEDRRAVMGGFFKLIPVEVAGALDATLTVKVVSQMGGGREVDITHIRKLPKEAALTIPGELVPEAEPADA